MKGTICQVKDNIIILNKEGKKLCQLIYQKDKK